MKFKKRVKKPNILYKSLTIDALIKRIMRCGKLEKAERIFILAAEIIAEELPDVVNIVDFVNEAVSNATPETETRRRRVGGADYSVPFDVKEARGLSIASRWIVDQTNKKAREETRRRRREIVSNTSTKSSSGKEIIPDTSTKSGRKGEIVSNTSTKSRRRREIIPYTLAKILIDCFNNTGPVIAILRENATKARNARIYAHYRW